MRRPAVVLALVLITTSWVAALAAAPSGAPPRMAAAVYAVGALICHQQPDRSFHRHGAQWPVCARCTGLYVGSLAGVCAWALIAGVRREPSARGRAMTSRAWRWSLVAAALPTIATVATGALGLWDGSNALRAALALPAGAVVAAVVTAAATGDLR